MICSKWWKCHSFRLLIKTIVIWKHEAQWSIENFDNCFQASEIWRLIILKEDTVYLELLCHYSLLYMFLWSLHVHKRLPGIRHECVGLLLIVWNSYREVPDSVIKFPFVCVPCVDDYFVFFILMQLNWTSCVLQILRMEQLMLRVLGFNMSVPTACCFCSFILREIKSDTKTSSLAEVPSWRFLLVLHS